MTVIIHERDIEAHLVEQCKARGWGCYKFTSPQRRNVPDRIVIVPPAGEPRAQVIFVECKAPSKRPTAGQLREHERLRALGCRVVVVDSFEAVNAFIAGIA